MTPYFYSPAELYRQIHLGNPGDIDVYLRAAQGAKSILDLGCGWGRVTIPLLQAGYHVTALDLEGRFIDELNREAERLCLANRLVSSQKDIRDLDPRLVSGAPFDRIFIPYNTLYALGGLDGVHSCLRSARQLLSVRGELWFDVYDMEDFDECYDESEFMSDDDEPVASFEHDGRHVVVTERTDVDHAQRRLTVVYTARLAERDEVLGTLSMTHDYFVLEQLQQILNDEDLELIGQLQPGTLDTPDDSQRGSNDEGEPVPQDGPVFFAVAHQVQS